MEKMVIDAGGLDFAALNAKIRECGSGDILIKIVSGSAISRSRSQIRIYA